MSQPEYDDFDGEEEERPVLGVADITPTQKYEFLQLIRQGYDRREAATALGYKARPWRSLTSPLSPYYDEEFTNSYFEAKGSPEAVMNLNDQIREEVKRRAMTDSDRLLEKLAMVHLPEFAVLRQKDLNVNVHAIFEQHLKSLPTDLLREVLGQLKSGKLDQHDVIELPRATASGSDGDDS